MKDSLNNNYYYANIVLLSPEIIDNNYHLNRIYLSLVLIY